jgi:hypothetical protein
MKRRFVWATVNKHGEFSIWDSKDQANKILAAFPHYTGVVRVLYLS